MVQYLTHQKKILQQFGFGELGVRIFFVISGYLITYLLLKEREATGHTNLRFFYTRRLLRIFPVFYSYLLVLFILSVVFDLGIPHKVFLGSALYLQNFAPWGSNWFVEHSWSLAVEEQFYILWPLIFLRIKKLRSPWILITVLMVGTLMRTLHYKYPHESLYFLAPFFKHADFLFSGCFMAFLMFYNREQVFVFIKRTKPILVYIVIFALWFFSKFEFHPVYDKIFIPLSGLGINISICFLLLYFMIQEHTKGFKFLNLPVIIFIGQLSYSLYIWQQLFLSGSALWISEFPQNIVLTFLAALTSYYFIEKPFLMLKKKFQPSLPM